MAVLVAWVVVVAAEVVQVQGLLGSLHANPAWVVARQVGRAQAAAAAAAAAGVAQQQVVCLQQVVPAQ
jgi:hypothetical protein